MASQALRARARKAIQENSHMIEKQGGNNKCLRRDEAQRCVPERWVVHNLLTEALGNSRKPVLR